MSDDIRPSSAVLRHEAAELSLSLSILDRHLARLRARRQVLVDELARTLDRLEIREAAESPPDVTPLASGEPVLAIEEPDESSWTPTVSPAIPHGDRCGKELRGQDLCWRIAGHAGKHRGSRSMLKRAQHKRERRAEGKS
jgi:hypothetical protein